MGGFAASPSSNVHASTSHWSANSRASMFFRRADIGGGGDVAAASLGSVSFGDVEVSGGGLVATGTAEAGGADEAMVEEDLCNLC